MSKMPTLTIFWPRLHSIMHQRQSRFMFAMALNLISTTMPKAITDTKTVMSLPTPRVKLSLSMKAARTHLNAQHLLTALSPHTP